MDSRELGGRVYRSGRKRDEIMRPAVLGENVYFFLFFGRGLQILLKCRLAYKYRYMIVCSLFASS